MLTARYVAWAWAMPWSSRLVCAIRTLFSRSERALARSPHRTRARPRYVAAPAYRANAVDLRVQREALLEPRGGQSVVAVRLGPAGSSSLWFGLSRRRVQQLVEGHTSAGWVRESSAGPIRRACSPTCVRNCWLAQAECRLYAGKRYRKWGEPAQLAAD